MTGRVSLSQGRARRCPPRPFALAPLQRPAEPATAHVQPAQQAREAAVSVAVAAPARAHAVQYNSMVKVHCLTYPAACTAAQIADADAGPYTVIADGSPGEIRPSYCRETFGPPKKVQKKMLSGQCQAARMPRLCGGPVTYHPTDLEHLCTHHARLIYQIIIVLGRDPGPHREEAARLPDFRHAIQRHERRLCRTNAPQRGPTGCFTPHVLPMVPRAVVISIASC